VSFGRFFCVMKTQKVLRLIRAMKRRRASAAWRTTASPLTLNQNQYITIIHINNSSVFASASGPYFYICSETKETLHNDDPCFINEIMISAIAKLFTRSAKKVTVAITNDFFSKVYMQDKSAHLFYLYILRSF